MPNIAHRVARRARRRALAFAVGAGIAIATAPAGFAQTGVGAVSPNFRKGNVEVGGFAGGSFGEDPAFLSQKGTTWNTMGGGNVAFAVERWLFPYFEASAFPGLARDISNVDPGAGGGSITADLQAFVFDFNAGAHLRVPLKESRVIPYAVLGYGVLRSSVEGTGTVRLSSGDTQSFSIPKTTATQGAVNVGAGLRVYATQSVGFRLEFKAYQPTGGDDTSIFGRVAGGVFFTLH